MISEDINLKYFIVSYDNHLLDKNALLDSIKNSNSILADGISMKGKSDYYISNEVPRIYQSFVISKLYPVISNVLKPYYDKIGLSNYWFQQYETNHYHSWHRHLMFEYAAVYYLELQDSNEGTWFRNDMTKEIIKPNVKEGDILIFPGHISHSSPPIISNKRKSIISMNICARYEGESYGSYNF